MHFQQTVRRPQSLSQDVQLGWTAEDGQAVTPTVVHTLRNFLVGGLLEQLANIDSLCFARPSMAAAAAAERACLSSCTAPSAGYQIYDQPKQKVLALANLVLI